ncbi:MAG: DNA replication protein [Variibacter sp.]|nr:DNA replication protein [Variibacter sp.]
MARHHATEAAEAIDPFLAQHIVGADMPMPEAPSRRITMDQAESPLAWLARRKGRNGEPLIAPEQLQAGERLRAEFTRAQLMPRVTANWNAAVAAGARDAGGPAAFTDAVIAARQRVRRALEEIGPEFGGLLLDVCCFLKGLEDVERERSWPPRSAKVVLQLGLDRLARHYGYQHQAQGRAHAPLRTWVADGECFTLSPADETGGF